MAKYIMGYLYLGTIGLMVVVNLSYLAYKITEYLIWLRRITILVNERNNKFAVLKAQLISKQYK